MSEMDLSAVQAAFHEHRGGRFRVDRFIGKGGMGTVFLGFDTGFRQVPCAIKVINLNLLEEQRVLERFRREAQIMVRVKHPAVVEVYDLDELDGGLPYIVLEWVYGGSLSDYIETHGPLGPQMAVHVMSLVCAGIEIAHTLGIIHRDIKPDNILLDRNGYPKVTDFGIAMMETGHTRLTQDGAGMGSFGFMAPEQMHTAKTVDARADVHALGVTLWSIIVGKLPPKGVFFRLSIDNEPELKQGIPNSLMAIIERATQMKPEDRYGSVAELREALVAVCDELPLTPATSTSKDQDDADTPTIRTSSLPIPSCKSFLVGQTFDQEHRKAAKSISSKPDLQEVAARLASPYTLGRKSPPPASASSQSAPSPVDTRFAHELFKMRRRSKLRAALIGLCIVCVGLVALWFYGRTNSTSETTQQSSVMVETQTSSESLPEPKAKEESVHTADRRDPEPAEALPRQNGIEMVAGQAVTPTPTTVAVKDGKPKRSPVDKQDKNNGKTRKPDKRKPEKQKRVPSGNEETAVAEAPKAPSPVMETVRVGLTFPEGDPVKVWLVGSSGRYKLPGSVPTGKYKVMAAFPSGDRVAISSLTVVSSGVTISCITQLLKCRSL